MEKRNEELEKVLLIVDTPPEDQKLVSQKRRSPPRPYVSESDLESENIKEELKKLGSLAGPLVLVSFLQYSLQMISVMFVGHLGNLSLSSASMATSFAGVTGFSVMVNF